MDRECTICGEEMLAGQFWFLVAQSTWEDTLRILEWQDKLATQNGIHRACCATHVQELVVHWMTTGSLDYPFAQASPAQGEVRTMDSIPLAGPAVDISCARQIGELAVHRESIGRVLNENPESLQIILDELLDALERAAAGKAEKVEAEKEMLLTATRQV